MRKHSEKGSFVLCLLSMMLLLQISFSITCIQKEREALLQLKRSFYHPDRDHCLASWNNRTDCCNWNGVGCDQITGHVTKIDLRRDIDQVDLCSYLYSNSIDTSLLEFKYLNYLDLSGNIFDDGQIPNFLGSMVELRYLNLSGVFFSGNIVPPHLGNLTKLDTLDLSFTRLQSSGNVEWISHLSSLQFLGLSSMNFSKASNFMQVLTYLPLLSSLRLSYCSLQSIHFSLSSLNYSSFLSRIQLLDLSGNQLNGPTPKAFMNMSSIKFLYLSSNQFVSIEGEFSSFIRKNCDLKLLDLSWNFLGRDVFESYENESMGCNGYDLQVLDLRGISMKRIKFPNWLGKFQNLNSIYLGYNRIYGQFPNWLGKFQNLKSIDLGYNQIYGPILASLGNLSSLEYLDLSNNALTGAIPTSFGRLLKLRELELQNNRLEEVSDECFNGLGNLEVLDISTNLLKGVLTDAGFANLSQLHTLNIGYNELLSLDIKSNWIPPFQLNYIDATSCVIRGSEFPQWLQTQKALVELWLSNTSLSASLPAWFTPQLLLSLDLSLNRMVGPLFTSIADQMTNLTDLFLNDNLINGSLPPSLCKLKSLVILDLSNNRLSGMVQGCLLTQNLIVLDLSSNNFSRTFPYSHGHASNIQELFLRNNNFEGSMPIVLKNSKQLEMLDLEGNKFSGNIPTWIGDNLGRLEFLGLRDNLFNGTIPSNLCKLTNLQILDLAHNQLEGRIPPNLSNFHPMTGNTTNRFTYTCWGSSCVENVKYVVQSIKSSYFNYSMTNLRLLVSIDLSNNSLVGFIPSEITKLKRLIGLNLSHNNLMGTVPVEIGEIESLESLDLSFNHLSGPIPRSLSKLNSLGMLKLSHNNFSSDIPREGHLSTFNEVSSFDGNPYLCGDPLPIKCGFENPSEPPFNNIDHLDEENDKWEKWLLYLMIFLGYTIGFWAVVGTLILKKSWRYTYFKFMDEAIYQVYSTIWRSIEILKGICHSQMS